MKEPHTMEASKTTKDVYKRVQALSRKSEQQYTYYEPREIERNLWQSFTHFLYIREREILAVGFGLILSMVSIGAIVIGPIVLKHI